MVIGLKPYPLFHVCHVPLVGIPTTDVWWSRVFCRIDGITMRRLED